MDVIEFQDKIKELIDELKAVCAQYGLGNDGNEFKIITQVFLYKFLNDKFACEIKKIEPKLNSEDWIDKLKLYSESDYDILLIQLDPNTARFKIEYLIPELFNIQNSKDFHKTFDDTLSEISSDNKDIFSVKTAGGAQVKLFDKISQYITDESLRDAFCRAIINKLSKSISFEAVFNEKFDFYATIFEYLIKDYNSNSGGKYAEYFTPHAVAKIMAAILVPSDERGNIFDKTCYDPSAGSGTLLMNLSHAIGEKNCSIFSQDISQKSSSLLRLNLVLNNLSHSIQNIVQGNTLKEPYHKEADEIRTFDYIVSNPPFKLDFSDFRDDLDTEMHNKRFFAGVPKVPAKAKDKMAIYPLFIQHIVHSLKKKGKAAVVVPTGFITAQSGIDKKIRQHLVDNKMLAGVVSMPSNIFANTGTNVSIVFISDNQVDEVVLIDASSLGETIKDGKNQKTVLTPQEEDRIISTFNNKEAVDDFSVCITPDDIKAKNYSLSAGQYFEVKIEYVDISQEEFNSQMQAHKTRLADLFKQSHALEEEISKQLEGLGYE